MIATTQTRFYRNALWLLLVIVLSLCATVVQYRNNWIDPIIPQDEGLLLVYPELILKGLIPSRDFATLYAPGASYVLAAVYRFFGTTIFTERAVALVFIWLVTFASFLLGWQKSILVGVAAGIASALSIRHHVPLAALSVYPAVALALFALFLAHSSIRSSRPPIRNIVAGACGLTVGLLLFFRQDFALAAAVASAILIASHAVRGLVPFIIGLMIGIIPMGAFIYQAGFDPVWASLILEPLRVGPGRVLPIVITRQLVILLATVAVIAGAAVYQLLRRPLGTDGSFLLGAAALALMLLPSALQRADPWHIGYVGAATGPLAVVALYMLTQRLIASRTATAMVRLQLLKSRGRDVWRATSAFSDSFLIPICVLLAITAVAIASIALHAAMDTFGALQKREQIAESRWVPLEPGLYQDVNQVVGVLNRVGKPGDRLFIGPADLRFSIYNDTYLYHLVPQFKVASYFLEMNPGGANAPGSRLADDLATADLLVLTSKYAGWFEPNASRIAGDPTPNRVVADSFCLLEVHGPFEVYRRCH